MCALSSSCFDIYSLIVRSIGGLDLVLVIGQENACSHWLVVWDLVVAIGVGKQCGELSRIRPMSRRCEIKSQLPGNWVKEVETGYQCGSDRFW